MRAFNAGSGPSRNKRDGGPCPGEAASPRELEVGRWDPKGPPGRRAEEGNGRQRPGIPGSAHLAAESSALGRARPPPAQSRAWVAPAPRGPAPRSSPRQPETHLQSVPRRRSLSVKRALRYATQGLGGRLAAPRLLLLGLPIGRGRRHRWGRGQVGGRRRGGARRSLGRGQAGLAL